MTLLAQKLMLGIFAFFVFSGQGMTQALTLAEQMPYFPGCDHLENGSDEKRNCSNEGLIAFINNYLQYPDEAQASEIEGTVYVSFVVETDGSVAQAKVLRDIGGDCGQAALDVLEKMPHWQPAEDAGEKVAVQLNLPIQFSFENQNPESEGLYKIHWGMLKGQRIGKNELLTNSNYPVQVRDVYGNEIPVSELLFSFEKNRSYEDAKSNGKMTPALNKIIRHSRKGGIFSIVATIQKDGEFVYVERTYQVVDK